MSEHEMLPEGESTAKWAIREPGFLGSIKQLLNCAPVYPLDPRMAAASTA